MDSRVDELRECVLNRQSEPLSVALLTPGADGSQIVDRDYS